jgi:alkaline phosphatase
VKLRNQLLAIACLLGFIAFGVLYFRTWVVQKPFGIILFIGDGMDAGDLTAARLYRGGADDRLALESMPNLALLSNYANDFAVPDSPAAASALATGVKVNNRSIAIDPNGNPLPSILALARQQGRATGFVTNGDLTDAGAAVFYAHASSSKDLDGIAEQFANGTRPTVTLGGGSGNFVSEAKGGRRKDGRDLLLELRQKGVELVRNKTELEGAAAFRTSELVGFFSNGDLARSGEEATNQQPSLSDMVRRAIEILQYNRGGYLLVVDAELISRAAEQNQGEQTLREILAFDDALDTALRYAGDKSLIVATGRHRIGGLSLNGYPLRQDQGVALIGTNAFGYPSLTWATGPNGELHEPAAPSPDPSISPAATAEPKSSPPRNEPAAFYAPNAVHNAEDVLAVGAGPGSQELKGFLDNTFIFELLKKNL